MILIPSENIIILDKCKLIPFNRYSILAPNALPTSGFTEGKEATSKILTGIQLEDDKYKLGHTKVFFRAGVLGALEDIREERLSAILSLLQAHIRGYLMRRNYQKLQDQRYLLILISCTLNSDCEFSVEKI